MSEIRKTGFEPGDIIGGVKILKPEPAHVLGEYRYDVEYGCCGGKANLSHKTVMWRRNHEVSKCPECTNAAKARSPLYEVGQVVTNLRIIAMATAGPVSSTVLTVDPVGCRHEGETYELRHTTMRRREKNGATRCKYCVIGFGAVNVGREKVAKAKAQPKPKPAARPIEVTPPKPPRKALLKPKHPHALLLLAWDFLTFRKIQDVERVSS
jgi:hypothetical protein